MIKVSVIVPVYKVPLEYLRECFDSLLAQTMQDCEFIVVSDGAPDVECSICEEYAVKDPRFKFFRREHAGVSATRNFGLEQTQGELITFLDCDDFLSSNALSLFWKKANQADIILANTQLFWNNSRKKLLKIDHSVVDKIRVAKVPNFAICGYCFKKSIIDKHSIKFNESLNLSEDRVFIYSYICKIQNIVYLKDSIYFYRQHQNSTCHKGYTLDNTIQQFHATFLIDQILRTTSNVTNLNRFHIISNYIRAALIGYYKSDIKNQTNYTQLKNSYMNFFGEKKISFLYFCYRARFATIISSVLHL